MLPQKEKDQQELRDQISKLLEQEQKLQGDIRAVETAVEMLRSQLQEDEETARKEKTRMEARAEALTRRIREHVDAQKAAKSSYDHILGSLREKENTAVRQEEVSSKAREACDRVLEETGFLTAEAAMETLELLRGQDAEKWLREERTVLLNHESRKNNTRELIRTREKQTEGRQTTDLDALEEEKKQIGELHTQLNEICRDQDNLLKNHRMVLKRAESIKQSLAESDRSWKRLDTLGSLAGGVVSESGKLSFDRYVMGTMFREILEMANRRMELMSGGRYELVHKIGADRRNAKAGLEIEVLDNNTGLQRGSGSLSGGETFFTSLSLALGLSDVVQNHAGGRQMDALFIDEGFGTLSDDVLDKALDVLNQLTEGNRLVGIISHVDKLDESIPQKVRVRLGERGSTLSLELS